MIVFGDSDNLYSLVAALDGLLAPLGTIGFVLPCKFLLYTRALLWGLAVPLLTGSCLWSVTATRPLPGCL